MEGQAQYSFLLRGMKREIRRDEKKKKQVAGEDYVSS
jgi:hypothetical protein